MGNRPGGIGESPLGEWTEGRSGGALRQPPQPRPRRTPRRRSRHVGSVLRSQCWPEADVVDTTPGLAGHRRVLSRFSSSSSCGTGVQIDAELTDVRQTTLAAFGDEDARHEHRATAGELREVLRLHCLTIRDARRPTGCDVSRCRGPEVAPRMTLNWQIPVHRRTPLGPVGIVSWDDRIRERLGAGSIPAAPAAAPARRAWSRRQGWSAHDGCRSRRWRTRHTYAAQRPDR